MSECEICGKSTDDLYEVRVEGATMLVCAKDSKGKEILHHFGAGVKESATHVAPKSGGDEGGEEIVENYGEVIRKARDALGLPLKVLAEKISETESSLARVEKQKMPPSDKTRKKIEKELGIKLTTKGEAKKAVPGPRRDEPMSLWEIAKKKGNKAGE